MSASTRRHSGGILFPADVAAKPRSSRNVALAGRTLRAEAWLPLRDAVLATAVLIGLIGIGSGGGATLDPALLGYLGAAVVAAFGTVWRLSAFWRRPASAFYARAWAASLAPPRRLGRAIAAARSDLVTQRFIRKR